MKFEQLLNIYWKKSFFLSNNVIPFDSTLLRFKHVFGVGDFFINLLLKKIETNKTFILKKSIFCLFNWKKKRLINIFISKIFNINFQIKELINLNVLLNYLVSSFRGRKVFLNMPSKGQRSRSNANTNHVMYFFLKKKIKSLLKNSEKKTFSNQNFFIKLKKKEKKKSIKSKKIMKIDTMLKLKTWV